MKQTNQRPTRILKIAEVVHGSGLSRAQVYRLAKAGKFPAPVKIGLRASGWVEAEVQAWVQRCIEGSRSGGASAVKE